MTLEGHSADTIEVVLASIYGAETSDYIAKMTGRPCSETNLVTITHNSEVIGMREACQYLPTQVWAQCRQSEVAGIASSAKYKTESTVDIKVATQLCKEVRMLSLVHIAADMYGIIDLMKTTDDMIMAYLYDCWGCIDVLDAIDSLFTAMPILHDSSSGKCSGMTTRVAQQLMRRVSLYQKSPRLREMVLKHPALCQAALLYWIEVDHTHGRLSGTQYCSWWQCRRNVDTVMLEEKGGLVVCRACKRSLLSDPRLAEGKTIAETA